MEQPCDHEVRRADQEDETDDGTRRATVRLRDEPDESLPDYRIGVAHGGRATDPAAILGEDARFTRPASRTGQRVCKGQECAAT